MSIKNVIFDLGGVILDLDFNKAKKSLFHLTQNPMFDFTINEPPVDFHAYEKGLITTDELFAYFQKYSLKGKLKENDIIDAWNEMLGNLPANRLIFLENLSSRFNLYLLSNINEIHQIAVEETFLKTHTNKPIFDYFKKVYYSHKINKRKPDAEIYDFVLNDSSLASEQTVFIDDLLPNIEAAKKHGIHAIHHSGELLENQKLLSILNCTSPSDLLKK